MSDDKQAGNPRKAVLGWSARGPQKPSTSEARARIIGDVRDRTTKHLRDEPACAPSDLKVALACDWLINFGGAEKVLLELHQMFPSAPIYTSKYDPKGITWFKDADVRTGYLQHFPNCLRKFIGPIRARYFKKLDLTDYDLVISVTGAEAKYVKTHKDKIKTEQNLKNRTEISTSRGKTTHICFCHVPTQYYWGLYDQYLKDPGFGLLNPLARLGLKLFVKPMRKKDYAAAKLPDYYITISNYAKQEIKRFYKREATVIYPPVDTKTFMWENSSPVENLSQNKVGKSQINKNHNKTIKMSNSQILEQDFCSDGYFITTSRMVNWKRLDLAIAACIKTHQNLVLIGDGPELRKLQSMAKGHDNIVFLSKMDKDELKTYLKNAKGYLFPSQEPFGIAPVEALAAGCPVLAYKKGGALDYIKDGENGLFFDHQTADSLASCINRFCDLRKTSPKVFSPSKISATALPYDTEIFKAKMKEYIDEKIGVR
ncbi:glycosyltransferase [Candidatus Saccharibacteria bacterium]|nr:glycosyltransferase [Candidatus Saccharibacteria bacterium]